MAKNRNQPKLVGRNITVNPKVNSHVKDSHQHVGMEGATLPPNMSKIAKQKVDQDRINMSHKPK